MAEALISKINREGFTSLVVYCLGIEMTADKVAYLEWFFGIDGELLTYRRMPDFPLLDALQATWDFKELFYYVKLNAMDKNGNPMFFSLVEAACKRRSDELMGMLLNAEDQSFVFTASNLRDELILYYTHFEYHPPHFASLIKDVDPDTMRGYMLRPDLKGLSPIMRYYDHGCVGMLSVLLAQYGEEWLRDIIQNQFNIEQDDLIKRFMFNTQHTRSARLGAVRYTGVAVFRAILPVDARLYDIPWLAWFKLLLSEGISSQLFGQTVGEILPLLSQEKATELSAGLQQLRQHIRT